MGQTTAQTTGQTTAQLAALLSERGQQLLARLAGEQLNPDTEFSLQRRLRRDYPAELVAAALTQQRLRLAASTKFSRAAEMFFTRDGLEQASGEAVAFYRAGRYAGARLVADLCCGIGGDLIALAGGREVVAVDRDPSHLEMALHNARVYGARQVTGWAGDVRDARLPGVEAVFIDPARRARGRRMRPGLSEPPLGWCAGLAARVAAVGIKAAPGLPAGAIPDGWEAEFIADGRELKEAVLWSPALAGAGRRATVLPGGHTMAAPPPAAALGPGAPSPGVPVGEPGGYLLDPSPAVTRAGLVEQLASELGAWKIDPRIAFLSADGDLRTPFARTLRIAESAPWNERDFARRLRAMGVGAADIRRRGLAGDVDAIHRRLRLNGPHRATVIMTRVMGRPWGMICSDASP